MTILLYIACWFLVGYLFWRAVYYGTLKYWHRKYKEDYSNSKSSLAWRASFHIILLSGPMNLIVMFFSGLISGLCFRHGIVLFYKIPDGTPHCRF